MHQGPKQTFVSATILFTEHYASQHGSLARQINRRLMGQRELIVQEIILHTMGPCEHFSRHLSYQLNIAPVNATVLHGIHYIFHVPTRAA
jgi:hypothetical protein